MMEFDKSKYYIVYTPDLKDKYIGVHGREGLAIIVNSLEDVYPRLSDKMIKRICDDFNRMYKTDPDMFIVNNPEDYIADIEKEIKKSVILDVDNSVFNNESIDEINRLLPKNSCISMSTDLDEESFIYNNEFREDLLFSDKYNLYSDLPLDKIKGYISTIHDIKREVEKYNLSNLERIIYIGDMIRKRVYKNDEYDLGITRDISRILEDDYIVCEGYANLYQAVCNDLGIACEKILWTSTVSPNGHASNIVYINDDKYDIHNFYEVDLTAHSKNENDDKYLLDYDFIRPLYVTDVLSRRSGYTGIEPSGDTLINRVEGRIARWRRMVELFAPDMITEHERAMIMETINQIYDTIGLNDKCDMSMDINEVVDKYKDRWTKYIPTEVLISAVYNVRRIEYINNSKVYKFDKETMMDIHKRINSFVKRRDEEKLLLALFGIGALDSIVEYNDYMNNITGDDTEERIEKDIDRVKVLSYMKQELQNKRNAS